MSKLNYKIIGKREIEGALEATDAYDVEWTHADGPIPDTVTVCVGSEITYDDDMVPTHKHLYEERPAKPRKVVKDQINVKPGSQMSLVMQLLEEKRERLAKNLGVEP